MEEPKSNSAPRKSNPLDDANIISRIFFGWLFPLFIKGYKEGLTEDDIYMHRKDHDSSKLGDKLEKQWTKQVELKIFSLSKALIRVFYPELIYFNMIVILHEIIRMLQPFLITGLIEVYERNKIEDEKNLIYLYTSLILLSLFLNTCTGHNYNLGLMQLGMKIRIASCSLIYRKALRLSKSAVAETTIGQMVNLLSNDVGRFDYAVYFIHNLYIGPIETALAMYLLYICVGWTGLAGALLLVLSIPAQSWLGKKTSQFRLKTATITDERIRLMNEIITGIQVIKMYTWESSFAKLVGYVRLEEMKYIQYSSVIRAVLMSCVMMLNRCAIAVCIITYVITGNPLTATYAYTVTSYYRLLNNVTNFFPTAVSQVAEIYISIKRIETFLLYEEVRNEENVDKVYSNSYQLNQFPKPIYGGKFMIEEEEGGPRTPLPGKSMVNKKSGIQIENASTKWLKSTPENNLENISIDVDAESIVAIVGPIGSGKTTLLHVIMRELELESGSIKVDGVVSYASQEPWLFNGSVRQNILFGQKYDQRKYNEVIKVCALKRDFALFPYGDRTLVTERGNNLSGGQKARINLARAVYKEADIYLLDDPLSAVDTHVGKHLFEECIYGYLKTKCVILITHQLQYLKKIKCILLLQDGKLRSAGTYADLKKADSEYSKLLTDIEDEEEMAKKRSRTNIYKDDELKEFEDQLMDKEDLGAGQIAGRVYLNYFKSGGSAYRGIKIAIAFILCQALESLTEYFVTVWVNIKQANAYYENWWLTPIFTGDITIFFYSTLIIILVIIALGRTLSFYMWCLQASTSLHNQMFSNIIYSPMKFFHSNPSGRILNRFSRDIGVLDEALPLALLDTTQIGLYVASISLVLGGLSVWIMVPTVLVGVLFYLMKTIFMRTSRSIKRIEAVTRSPIFTHLSVSLQGLTTIRAFGAQKMQSEEFDRFQNMNSAAFFLYVAANRTFGFWLDFVCVLYIAFVIAILIFVKSETFGGNVGLALTQAMALTGLLQWGMRQWSEFENQMNSVERVQEYADLKQESDEETVETSESWPENGKIEFANMSLRYNDDGPYVLNNLNIVINPKEKVGIVGRTGAGKSSIIQALFRLTTIDGSILIDGVDTKTVKLNKLRSKISIIPQEPVLFSGTLRKNLDPFDEYEDEILWGALEEVELKHAVEELPFGLDSKMAEGGSNLSVGQRQLVCLARAIVGNNKILILDEATANVDLHTDILIQTTIRKKFETCTVLTIAHRLNTIMDSDKILVMDAGRAVEFDHPYLLLQNTEGVFYSLVMQTGKSTASHLKQIAQSKRTLKENANSVVIDV